MTTYLSLLLARMQAADALMTCDTSEPDDPICPVYDVCHFGYRICNAQYQRCTELREGDEEEDDTSELPAAWEAFRQADRRFREAVTACK